MISRLALTICAATLLAGCGSGGSSSGNGTGGNGGNGGNGGGAVTAPAVISTTAGSTSSGVDIAVVSPASTTPPIAQIIGAASASSNSLSLTNTVARISKAGGSQIVALCGPGLSSSMTVGVGDAPGVANSDFTISGITSVNCTDNSGNKTPGVQFNITIASGAALGARTVFLQNTSNNDVTTFTGGVEVVP